MLSYLSSANLLELPTIPELEQLLHVDASQRAECLIEEERIEL
jgi:hypothetical protein